ncbi:glycyl-radical enzyme activating protein [Marispirochaeta sp.]|jgi:pyruvate formate lyase activating enzyme|uniref:glycyl-radical enzyme activating protein n=1 Tax=Marispirochaeta sp. TaxID=2038653 RepID=UPI002D1E46C3|nr:glycyl-radical enzyme activating protein [Marispirochaeta sp.]
MEPAGIVFDIQRFSLHDGPGIRTLIFLKGCPLSCLWCCNPESQAGYPQIGYDPQKCISCNACIEVCPCNAVRVDEEGQRIFAADLCADCAGQPCADACPTGAIERFGELMGVEDVMDQVCRDEPFYRKSGGGVTVSGGEPLAQADFTYAILKECRKLMFSTAVETSGYCRAEDIEKVAEVTDLFLFDIKHVDGKKHAQFTGVDTGLIMDNLRLLRGKNANIIVRIPLIPGFNTDEQTLSAIADFSGENGIREIHLLPYHRLGRSKYDRLSIRYRGEDIPLLSDDEIESARNTIEARGICVTLGG